MAALLLNNASPLDQQTRREDYRAYITVCLLLAVPTFVAAAIFNGIALWLIVALLIMALIYVEPRFGLYLVLIAAALDTVPYDPLMWPLARIGLPIHGAYATPVELLFLWSLFCWLHQSARDGTWPLPKKSVLISGTVFTLLVVLSIARGIFNGGSLYAALWETRALFIVLPIMVMTAGLLTERRHIFEYITIVVASQVLMSAEELWRYLTLVRPAIANPALNIPVEAAFNHDGAVIVATMSVVGIALIIWWKDLRINALGAVIMALTLFVVLGSRRRAAIIGAEVGVVTLAAVLLMTNWRRFAVLAPVALVIGIIYIGAFWNSANSLGQPVRAFRSVFEQSSASARDQSSDNYRKVETSDLWAGIRSNPADGVGFGVPFPKPSPLQNLSKGWPFWKYIPHNNVLWLWNKGGILTFMAFWFFLGTSMASAISFARQQRDPAVVAIVATVTAYFVMLVMFAWVDLGLTSSRLLVLFGTSLGLLSVLENVWREGRPSVEQEIGVNASA